MVSCVQCCDFGCPLQQIKGALCSYLIDTLHTNTLIIGSKVSLSLSQDIFRTLDLAEELTLYGPSERFSSVWPKFRF